MNVYKATILYRDPENRLQVFEYSTAGETPVAFRHVLSQAWAGLCREVERAHGTEDVYVHWLVESIQITREP